MYSAASQFDDKEQAPHDSEVVANPAKPPTVLQIL